MKTVKQKYQKQLNEKSKTELIKINITRPCWSVSCMDIPHSLETNVVELKIEHNTATWTVN